MSQESVDDNRSILNISHIGDLLLTRGAVKSLGLLGRICQFLPPINTIDILEDHFGIGLISDGSSSRANIRYILKEFSVLTVSLMSPMLCG